MNDFISGQLITALSRVEGLDVRRGLLNLGANLGAYIDVLKTFCSSYDGLANIIRGGLRARDWKDYGIRLHGFKGSLDAIGAGGLGLWARRLEFAGKAACGHTMPAGIEFNWSASEAAAICEAEAEPILEAIAALRARLIDAGLFRLDAAKRPVTACALAVPLTKLKAACADYDITALDALVESFKTITVNETVDGLLAGIAEAVTTMDYDIAAAKADEILSL
jgi:HPt (histidine-containing phosphotransfer) domain-containing protein